MLMVCSAAIGQSGDGFYPTLAFHRQCDSCDVPAMRVREGALSFDSIPYTKDYTVIAVYKPTEREESALWMMSFDESTTRGVTTERIFSMNKVP